MLINFSENSFRGFPFLVLYFFLRLMIVHEISSEMFELVLLNLTRKESKNGHLGIFLDFKALVGEYRLCKVG